MLKYIRKSEMYLNSFRTSLAESLQKDKNKKWFKQYYQFFEGKKGFEVGGPSPLFSGDIFPIYQLSETIDGCNFSDTTVWEGEIKSGTYQYYKNKKGVQYISEGSDLHKIQDEQYDFLLSCHNLEHIANPLKTITEWKRVVKKGGVIFLVLPDKRFTFDKKRPYTTFEHLLSDFANDTAEDDLTHIPEVLQLHNLKLDFGSEEGFEKFKARCEQNFQNRCLHHHVFSLDVLRQMLEYLGMEVVAQKFVPSIHQVVIGRK